MNSIFVSRQFEAHSYESLDPLIEIEPNTRKGTKKDVEKNYRLYVYLLALVVQYP